MINRANWTTDLALRYFRDRATALSDDFEGRYGWTKGDADGEAHTQAEVEAIYDEVIAKIPAGATKVLELGCGGGHFAERLRAALPAIGYRGIDIVPENVTAAETLLPAEDFDIGNAWEYLAEAAVDWDFIVSVGCLFACTDQRGRGDLFDLMDAKSSLGFIVLGRPEQLEADWLDAKMTASLAASTNVAESYHVGARDFLTDATLKGEMLPFYVHRDSTSVTAPEVGPQFQVIATGRFNRVLGWQAARDAKIADADVPAQVAGITSSGGLVTGTADVDLDESWVPTVRKG